MKSKKNMKTIETVAGIALILAVACFSLAGYNYVVIAGIISELEIAAGPLEEAKTKMAEFEKMGEELEAIMPELKKLPALMPVLEQMLQAQ